MDLGHDKVFENHRRCLIKHRVLESAAHRAPLASGAPKIASASGARKKNSERERERRSEKSGSA